MVNEKMSELESASAFPLESLNGKVDVAVEKVRLEKRKSASRKVVSMVVCSICWFDFDSPLPPKNHQYHMSQPDPNVYFLFTASHFWD
jgi:hypothetical protein